MTVKESTFRIMSALFDNKLALQCNWLGRSRGKIGFSSLTLRPVVCGLFFSIIVYMKLDRSVKTPVLFSPYLNQSSPNLVGLCICRSDHTFVCDAVFCLACCLLEIFAIKSWRCLNSCWNF